MITPLGKTHTDSLQRLLSTDTTVNLFLLGFLQTHGLEGGSWVGHLGPSLDACTLILPGRLVVPYAPEPNNAFRIGAHLRGRYRPSMLVGPRAASDALWQAWTLGEVEPRRHYNQQLYSVSTPPIGANVPGFRRARAKDWRVIAQYSAEMQVEDLGQDPRDEEAGLHERVVKDRISRGITWIIERHGEILFQVNVGTSNEHGCQIGGTYVPPHARGRGLATEGVRAMVRELLQDHSQVTLHVNEVNTPAVRTYERVGFKPICPFRLITL